MSETNEPTFGEKAVELHFNPSGLEASLHLKTQAAAFIDPNARQTPLFRAGKDSADAVGGIRN